jgi:molybdopterin-containing oxidoreductase family iron-sulfur binding subunit
MRNPDVSVRMRGVMEKCTYCIQRVNGARIQSETSGQPIKDGDVKTACQQVCPTNAIVFGDLNDTGSQVRKLKETPLNYALLGELGTRPRTTYLAKVNNPNPQIKE